jgi:PAS domain S-box-containing protein
MLSHFYGVYERMSLKTKNTLITMAVLSALILTVVGITYRSTEVIIEETIVDHQLAMTTDVSKTTELWLNQQMRILDATSASVALEGGGANSKTMRLLKMAMKAGHFSDVYIGLTNGILIDGADWSPSEGYDPRIRPWYRRALEVGYTAFTTPYIDLVTMELVIALVTPLYVEGEFIGVMGADTILDTLVDNLMSVKVGESGYAFIVEKDGTILVHPNQDFVMKMKLQETESALVGGIEKLQRSSFGAITYQDQESGQDNILAYKNITNTDWFLCTTIPRAEAYELTRKTTVLFAVEKVLVVLGVLALVTLIGGSASVLILFVFNRRFETTVQQHKEEMTGINEDLEWNISKRKEVETSYQTLFLVANDAILLSKKLQYVECNEKAVEMFGFLRAEVVGMNMLDFSPEFQPNGRESSVMAKNIIKAASAGEQQFFEWTFLRANGTEFAAEVGLKVLHLDNQELTLSSIRDISKRVNAEKQLRQAQKMAAMGEMLGAIAHQWRQPLNTLSTYIASLQSAYYNNKINKNFVQKLTDEADSQIQFMSKTIDDFRLFFRPSKDKVPFDVIEAIDSAVKLLQAQLKQSDVELKIEHDDINEPLVVYGYQSEFVHVLVNILANARDAIEERASQEKTGVLRLIEIDVVSDGAEVVIRVKDYGCGIPEHLLAKVFDPYFTTKSTLSGAGIGLYMAKIIVEKEMNGFLSVKNTGTGAQFTLRLPTTESKQKGA